MRHLRLTVAYDGTNYAGFQVQPDCPTVQGQLQSALTALVGEPVKVIGASRTDAGVHARGQVVTFTTDSPIPVERLAPALNALLPADLACVGAAEVPADFHPQYAARRKRYLYRILNQELRCPFEGRFAWHLRPALDVAAMQEGLGHLVGRHDFAAFCAANGSAKTSTRTLYGGHVVRRGPLVETSVEGDGFLYMMVRIIVGTLVEVGQGRRAPGAVAEILAGRDRTRAGPTAPPQGLTLMHIEYDETST